jgi:hypothetical protein
MKYLYKYPQREFPCRDPVETNRGRSREQFEYELLSIQAAMIFIGAWNSNGTVWSI